MEPSTALDYATIEPGIRRERGIKEREDSFIYDAIMDLREGGEIDLEQGGMPGGVYGGIYGNSEEEAFRGF